ncbi:hypothetical protein [Oceanobacillus sp. 1P07AA]|uniref:hypothetical protein n=1 Tax=Oceanobacillus sp. 1P07AA TaxID=3132293 RepID=UPI0039A5F94D
MGDQEVINSYLKQIKEIQNSINELNGNYLLENHKRTLLLNLMDSLSKGVYGDKYKYSGKKFERFVIDYCDWKEAEKVSLQQLL